MNEQSSNISDPRNLLTELDNLNTKIADLIEEMAQALEYAREIRVLTATSAYSWLLLEEQLDGSRDSKLKESQATASSYCARMAIDKESDKWDALEIISIKYDALRKEVLKALKALGVRPKDGLYALEIKKRQALFEYLASTKESCKALSKISDLQEQKTKGLGRFSANQIALLHKAIDDSDPTEIKSDKTLAEAYALDKEIDKLIDVSDGLDDKTQKAYDKVAAIVKEIATGKEDTA